jgi:hypothetical protein
MKSMKPGAWILCAAGCWMLLACARQQTPDEEDLGILWEGPQETSPPYTIRMQGERCGGDERRAREWAATWLPEKGACKDGNGGNSTLQVEKARLETPKETTCSGWRIIYTLKCNQPMHFDIVS